MAAAGVVTVEVRETSHATAVVDEVTYQEIVAQEVETAVSSQLPTSASEGSQ